MATTPPRNPKEDEMRRRILTHMQNDHSDSLSRYLQHQYSLSEEQASDAELIDMNLKQLVIKANKQCYTLSIIPPMTSYSEARKRLVEMDHEARTSLGLPVEADHAASNTANGATNGHDAKEAYGANVIRYVPPTGFHLVVFIAALATYIIFARPENLKPGSPVYDYALRYAPRFAAFCQRIQFMLVVSMASIHGVEAAFMSERLRKSGVSVGSTLWLKWTASCFVEGYGSWIRLNKLVKRNKE